MIEGVDIGTCLKSWDCGPCLMLNELGMPTTHFIRQVMMDGPC